MAEYKNQHYLPQSYLNGFTKVEKAPNGEKTDLLWIYDINKKNLKQRSPLNIAKKPYYYSVKDKEGEYDHRLEKEFSKIEGSVKELFNRINSDLDIFINKSNEKLNRLMPEDKELLITFVFLMLKRVPTIMDEVKDEMTKIARSQEDKYKEVNLNISSEVIKRNSLWIVENLGLSQEYNIPKKFASKKILISYISNDKSSFITSDNPVTRWRKKGPAGFGFDDTEIYFPINQRCFLTMYDSGEDIGILKLTNRKQIYSLNLYNARFAKEMLISRDRELIEKICKVLKYEILA